MLIKSLIVRLKEIIHLFPEMRVTKKIFTRAAAKKRLWPICFPINFTKFLRTPFLKEHTRWLLLAV